MSHYDKQREEFQGDYDTINWPKHYNKHPSGIQPIEITEYMNFCMGNAIKYIMRCELKGKKVEDLKKAVWYLEREIEREEKSSIDGLEQEYFDEWHSRELDNEYENWADEQQVQKQYQSQNEAPSYFQFNQETQEWIYPGESNDRND